ncbi:MAG: DUF420 domain-containing protein [Candidatus Zixiibacteriota bacterium]
MNLNDLPTLNALLNLISSVFLLLGFINIKQGNINIHKKLMLSALISSLLFLTSYLIYHYNMGSVPYACYDWTRPVYFAILIPHVILAGLMTPFIVITVWWAWRDNFLSHKKLARFVWPVWMFVSVTGVLIYLLMYVYCGVS